MNVIVHFCQVRSTSCHLILHTGPLNKYNLLTTCIEWPMHVMQCDCILRNRNQHFTIHCTSPWCYNFFVSCEIVQLTCLSQFKSWHFKISHWEEEKGKSYFTQATLICIRTIWACEIHQNISSSLSDSKLPPWVRTQRWPIMARLQFSSVSQKRRGLSPRARPLMPRVLHMWLMLRSCTSSVPSLRRMVAKSLLKSWLQRR